MNIDDSCKLRRIKTTTVKTPLIVPSFSSAFSKDPTAIGRIHNSINEYICDVSLVSAYDLYYEYIKLNDISCSELVYLDSGNYETVSLGKSTLLQDWDSNLYLDLIKKNNSHESIRHSKF